MVAWFPAMICWHLDLFDRRLSPGRRLAALAGIFAFCVCSYPVAMLPVYSVIHFCFLLLFGRGRERGWPLAGVVALWTAYLLLYAPVVAALLDYLPEINRVYEAKTWQGAGHLLRSMVDALSFLPADAPGLSILLCSAAALHSDARLRKAWLLLGLSLLMILLNFSDLSLFMPEGIVRKVDLYHFRQAVPFLISLAAAVYVDGMVRRGLPPLWLAALAAGASSLGAGADVLIRNAIVLAAALGWAAALRGGGFPLRRSSGAVGGGVAACCLALGYMFTYSSVLSDISHVVYARAFGGVPELARLRDEAKAPFRVGCLDLAPAVALSNGLETVGEKKVLFSRHYKDYVIKAIEPQLAPLPRLDEQARKTHIELYLTFPLDSFTLRRDVAINPGRKLAASMVNLPMLEAMNVKYLLASKPVAGLEELADPPVQAVGGGIPVLKGTRADAAASLPLLIYRLKGGFERAYVVGGSRLLPTAEDVLDALGSAGEQGLRANAFFAQDDPAASGAPVLGGQGRGRVLSGDWRPDRISLRGEADGPALLVVTNNWHKGWSARVNGQSAPLLRANASFQAVPIPAAGAFEVELRFEDPASLRLHWVSLAGLALLASLLFWPKGGPPAQSNSGPPAETGSDDALRTLRAPRSGRGTRLALLGVTALWSASFLLVRVLREPAASHRPMAYTWVFVTLAGLLLGLWWLRAADGDACATEGSANAERDS